jgi:dolichol-phosphate mannosyltransferase
VLLPTLNEEATIGQTIDDVRRYAPDSEILVIDSCSGDRTVDVAINMGATVISVDLRGKGRAVREALGKLATKSDYYIMMDSDYTYPARHIPQIIEELSNGVDVVMGYRKKRDRGAMTAVNTFGNKALSFLASVLYNYWVRDVCTGMWGFRKEALEDFNLTSNGFTLEADLFTNAVKVGCEIRQIPIGYRARPDGSVAKLKVSDGFKIGWFLIKRRFGRG